MDTSTDGHDAFREQRKVALYWLRNYTGDLDLLNKLEGILPSFVRRRYRFGALWGESSVEIAPLTSVTDDPSDNTEADKLHADVNKLFLFLLERGETPQDQGVPKRTLAGSGRIKYEFTVKGLPGFEKGLAVTVSGLPAGSACRITKKVKGTRVVEDVEYEMVCDDENQQAGM